MKRYIRSDSPYYTTRKAQLPVVDTEAADYYPMASRDRKHTKRLPGKEKSNAYKNLLKDEFDVLDSYTDAIDTVFAELSTYKDSIVSPIATLIQMHLEHYKKDDRYLVSDELQELDTLITAAFNLEILENACLQFQELTGCTPIVSFHGPSVNVRYATYIGAVLTPKQVWIALSGEYSAEQIVDTIMMTKHRTNIKKYGDPIIND